MSDTTHKPFRPTHYEVLDLSMGADEGEIRRAYDRIKQIYSEDSLAVYGLYTPEEVREVREQIERAFRVLIDPENRRTYDQTLVSEPVKKKKQLQITIRARENEDEPSTPQRPASDPLPAKTEEKPAPEDSSEATFPGFKRGELEIPDDAVFSGEFLRNLREAHRISLRDISETTKVSIGSLRMIENEAWDTLPALVYVKGFIVQYAKYLGVDERRMLADLVARIEASGKFPKE